MSEHEPIRSIVISAHAATIIWDAISIVVVSMLYALGSKRRWEINSKALLLSYIVLKSVFLATRIVNVAASWLNRTKRMVILILSIVNWALFSSIIYGYAITMFFDSRNNCRKVNMKHWMGHLFMTIEGILVILITSTMWCTLYLTKHCQFD